VQPEPAPPGLPVPTLREERLVGTVVRYASVSVDGIIADEND
jgi:hypothetical protein